MARTDTLPHFLTDVANAIRAKAGTSDTIQASSFDTAISNIPSGGGGTFEVPSDVSLCFTHSLTTDWSFLSDIDFSNVEIFDSMFESCSIDGETMPQIDTSSATSMDMMFNSCSSLETAPTLNTSNVTFMTAMFGGCSSLVNVPQYDTSSVEFMDDMFMDCGSLSETSLNNILGMCASVNTEIYGSSMTLTALGIDTSIYDPSTIEGLNNYQDFVDAGWTIE